MLGPGKRTRPNGENVQQSATGGWFLARNSLGAISITWGCRCEGSAGMVGAAGGRLIEGFAQLRVRNSPVV